MTRIKNSLDFLNLSLKINSRENPKKLDKITTFQLVQNAIGVKDTIGPKCYGCQGYEHMKPECPTYLKSINKRKALVATLSNTEPEVDLEDSDQEGIASAFTITIDSSKEFEELIDEEEELMESKFEEMDEKDDIHTAYSNLYKNFEKHEKLYRLATRKLSEVELEQEELSTKVDEANQTIRTLQFENNFLTEKTKKMDAKLFQVRAQLKRTLSAKLDEMLNFQKAASDRTTLKYNHSLYLLVVLPLVLYIMLCLFLQLLMTNLR